VTALGAATVTPVTTATASQAPTRLASGREPAQGDDADRAQRVPCPGHGHVARAAFPHLDQSRRRGLVP
jgi:hypothetical protein